MSLTLKVLPLIFIGINIFSYGQNSPILIQDKTELFDTLVYFDHYFKNQLKNGDTNLYKTSQTKIKIRKEGFIERSKDFRPDLDTLDYDHYKRYRAFNERLEKESGTGLYAFFPVIPIISIYDLPETFYIFPSKTRILSYFFCFRFENILNQIFDKNHFSLFANPFQTDTTLSQNIKVAGFMENYMTIGNSSYYSPFNRMLIDTLQLYKKKYLNRISSSSLSNKEKEFLKLYFQAILSYHDLSGFNAKEMQSNLQGYLDQYSTGRISAFIKKNLWYDFHKGRWGLGIGLFSGYQIFNGNIGDYMPNAYPIGVDFDIAYKKWIIKSSASANLPRPIKTSFRLGNHLITRDSTVSFSSVFLGLGYNIYAGKSLRVTPFFGLSGNQTGFRGINVPKIELFNNGMIGMDIEFKFPGKRIVTSYKDAFRNLAVEKFYFTRLRLAFSPLEQRDLRFNGSIFYINLCIGYFGYFPEEIK